MRVNATTALQTSACPTDRGAPAPASSSFAAALAEVNATTKDSAASAGLRMQDIQAGFDAWRQQRQADGADSAFLARLDGTRAAYLSIVDKALASDGFDRPVEFVQRLSPSELQTLQTLQSLADPIEPATLTQEGAFNLLVPANLSRDLDQDGLTQVGKARCCIFPPNEAPPSVKDAWLQSTEGLDPGQRASLALQLWSMGRGGLPIDGAALGKADFHQAGFSYDALAGRAIDSLQFNLPYAQTAQQRTCLLELMETLRTFRTALAS